MKYYLDTEFLEGTQKTFFGGKTKPTIDLISIGLVDETGREFYAINKDFNLKEAWNRHDLEVNKHFPQGPAYYKNYWLRDNVLRPIFDELYDKCFYAKTYWNKNNFCYKHLKLLIEWNGKSLPEIANGICAFIYGDDCEGSGMSAIEMAMKYDITDKTKNPEFYAYYADYDWVVFCWIFGSMMSLPKGFPMYCRDLKQILDENIVKKVGGNMKEFDNVLNLVKGYTDYPKQTNEHNALADAKWNKQLHEFLNKLT